MTTTKLYVGNLSYDTTQDALHDLFAQYGDVSDCAIIMDRMTGRSRGFAFITMSKEDAATACSELNGKELDSRELRINEAEQRAAGGGGRSGGGGGRGGFGGGGGGGRGGFGGGGGGGGGRGGRGGWDN